MALADFRNPQKLERAGSGLFQNPQGAERRFLTSKQDGAGAIKAKMIEASNVDLSQEFGDLILIQRGFQASSPNQVLVSLALFLTAFTMMPTIAAVNETALQPFLNGQLAVQEAMDQGAGPLREFMLRQVHDKDLKAVYDMARKPLPDHASDVGLLELTSAFMLNELRVAFKIGFVVLLPLQNIEAADVGWDRPASGRRVRPDRLDVGRVQHQHGVARERRARCKGAPAARLGSRLLEESLPRDLGGTCKVTYVDAGVNCELEIPL